MEPLFIGIDAGGTATRSVICTADGAVVARHRAGGANQHSSGGRPADALATVLSEVDGATAAAVVAGVVGAAGAGGAGRGRAQADAGEAWQRAGIGGAVTVVTDLAAAFAAGTPAPAGALLIAGTGAVAAAFEDHRLVRRAGGYGWLASDEGSAVWLGKAAVQAVFRALDGRGPQTVLADRIAPELAPRTVAEGDPGSVPESAPGAAVGRDREARAQALVADVFGAPPAALGRHAPVVGEAAEQGDAVARSIVESAVAELLRALVTVAGAARTVVLGGGLLLGDGPVGAGVRAGVRERFGVEPRLGVDGAAGAAALAIARHTGRPVSAAVHQRLTAGT
jgi:glucosamine kinase